jgi:hypothetical protein
LPTTSVKYVWATFKTPFTIGIAINAATNGYSAGRSGPPRTNRASSNTRRTNSALITLSTDVIKIIAAITTSVPRCGRNKRTIRQPSFGGSASGTDAIIGRG